MASKVTALKPDDSEYEIVEGESDQLITATIPRINPSTLKLRHRIGRGLFGDVWLATLHQSTEDYDEHHEVALKMLFPVKEDQISVVLDKFDALFSKCQELDSVCQLRGVSAISGKISIIMNFYEGSIADKMARLRGGKLSLPDVLRYGVNMAQGILQLHSKGLLVLNLKPSNFLLSKTDKAVVGDVGIPYLLLVISLPSSDLVMRLGSPNYMAPEQWQPEVRGPLSFETDSWGFGCTIVEMLTGIQPWNGKSVDEIYNLVVIKHEKPYIPGGLPPPVENLLRGCFMYDFRSRPSISDILCVLKGSQNAVYSEEGDWTGIESRLMIEKSAMLGYSEWFLSKDHLQIGDTVRSRKPAYSCKLENMEIPVGTVVGLEHDDGFALVRVHGIHDPLRVHVSTVERITNGLSSGDWVRLKKEFNGHSPVGILHSIDRDGNVTAGFIGIPTLWKGKSLQLQMAETYCIGQFVKLKANVVSPRFKWPRKPKANWATGKISQVFPNGCLEVKFPGIFYFRDKNQSFLADPTDVEAVHFSNCDGIVKKYEHLEDYHWTVRPLVIALGIFTAMKLGFFIGNKIRVSKGKRRRDGNTAECEVQDSGGKTSGRSRWLVFGV